MKKTVAVFLLLAMLFSVAAMTTACKKEAAPAPVATTAPVAQGTEPSETTPQENPEVNIDTTPAETLPATAQEAVQFAVDAFSNGKKGNLKGSMTEEAWKYNAASGYTYEDIYGGYDAWYADCLTLFPADYHVTAALTASSTMEENAMTTLVAQFVERYGMDEEKFSDVLVVEGTKTYKENSEPLKGAAIRYAGAWYYCVEEDVDVWIFAAEESVRSIIEMMGQNCG